MRFRLLLGALAAIAFAAPAGAQNVAATDPMTIVRALQSAGYRALLGRDERGDPRIDSGSGGTSFLIYFLGCTGGRDCRAVQFHSSYDTAAPPLETINRWNRDVRHARAYVLPGGDPVLEMDLNLDAPGGMSRALFVANLDRYVRLLPDFERLIRWRSAD